MALLDFLKRKEDIKKSKPAKKAEKVSVKKPSEKKIASVRQSPKDEGDKKEPAVAKSSGGARKFSYDAIKKPHISEKASYLSEKDQYIFEVSPNYNKNEIKKSVEGLYNVDVLSVNVVKIPSKKRRLGKTEGFRKAYKKAIVRIKNGQKIEIL